MPKAESDRNTISSERDLQMEALSLRSWLKPYLQPLGPLFVAPLIALFAVIVLGMVLLHQPLALVVAIWQGAWGSAASSATTLTKTSPLVLTGLAVAIAYRTGLLNIGCEGQLAIGALTTASVAVRAAALPAIVLVPLSVVAGALAGAIWAWPAVWLRQRRGVHEVISTLLLNYVAIYVAEYLVRGPLGDGSAMARTPVIPEQAVWEPLIQMGTLGITAAPLLALILSLLAQAWLCRTIWGFEATAVGCNAIAAERAGIDVPRWRTRLFLTSGAIAGLAGALEVLTVHHRFYAAFSPGYGFDGITVAFLVKGEPGWLWMSGLLLATLRAADKWLQLALGISPNVILILVAMLLLAVACREGWVRLVPRWLRSLWSPSQTPPVDPSSPGV
jgi:general nucleoside transport system permease protein